MSEREVPEGFVDGNKRLEKLLERKPHLAEKVKELRKKMHDEGRKH
jgi:hypothetical protein